MRHLSEDAAIRRCDTLDRIVRTVHVPLLIEGDISEWIAILRRYLTVRKELIKPLRRCDETSLAVGCRIDIYSARLCVHQPRALIGHDLRIDHAGDMTANRVESQRRCICILSGDRTVRNKTELDERLEAVADTERKTVALI